MSARPGSAPPHERENLEAVPQSRLHRLLPSSQRGSRQPGASGDSPSRVASAAQRVLSLQRTAGNAAMTQALQRTPASPSAGPDPARSAAAPSTDRPVTAAQVGVAPVVARQPAPGNVVAPLKATVDLGWFEAENNQQLAAAGRVLVAQMRTEMADLDGGGEVWGRADEWVHDITPWLPYLESKAGEPIEASVAQYANRKIREYDEIRVAAHEERIAPLRAAWQAAERQAEEAAEQAESMSATFDDALRTAFRKGDSDTVKEVVNAIKSSLSIGRNLRSLAFDISKELLKLDVPSGTKMRVSVPTDPTRPIRVQIVSVSKYTDKLTKLNRGLSVVSLAMTIADRSKRATEVEQGMKDLNDVVSGGSDVGSLVGLPPHVGLYMTLYLKPMLKVIMGQISRLADSLSDINRTAVKVTGDLMYPGAEPGGQPMFDFMRAVMHAGSPADLPRITGKVEEYLYDHRDKFGVGAESSVPTEGWWVFEDLDSGAARSWVFSHRGRVWAMLYGSMPVPPQK